MGLTYTNPDSPLHQPTWRFAKTVGSIGGTVMFVAMLLSFIVLFGTLLQKKSREAVLELPVSEPYHDEDVAAVQSFRPWLVGAVILLIVAYTAPFLELARKNYRGAPPYSPASPVAQKR